MPSIDGEGVEHLFNRYPSEPVSTDDLIADITAHQIERGYARAPLLQLLEREVLVQAPGNTLRRPE